MRGLLQRIQQWRRDWRHERFLFEIDDDDVEIGDLVTVELYEQIIYGNATMGSMTKLSTRTYVITGIEEADSGMLEIFGEPS